MKFWFSRFFSTSEYHKRALEEVFVVTVVAIFPLFLLPFVASIKSPAAPFDFSSTIWSAVSSGQLYLYSFSTFGTIIWLCLEDVSETKFPPRKYFSIAAILCAFLCLIVYGSDPSLTKALNPVLIYISIAIFAIYCAMYYALLVFRSLRAPPLSEIVESEVQALIGRSRNSRSAK